MTLPEAVRRACDKLATKSKCRWPECHTTPIGCIMFVGDDLLTTLLAEARAEGAAEERAECVKLAEDWAAQNGRQSIALSKRAALQSEDIAEMTYANADTLASCASECSALAAALRARAPRQAARTQKDEPA